MPPTNKKHDTKCPVAFALDTFGDRWSLVIIRDMLMKGYQTYSEFLGSGEKIATNVLADRLQGFESSGIVTKSRDPDNHRRYLYKLTEKGADLAPVLLEMVRWSGKHDPNTVAMEVMMKRIENDIEGYAKELRNTALNRD